MWTASSMFFFFNDTATTEIYTLSLHDALPIFRRNTPPGREPPGSCLPARVTLTTTRPRPLGPTDTEGERHARSEEHTSELQSRQYLVCRLLLEKKTIKITSTKDTSHHNWSE